MNENNKPYKLTVSREEFEKAVKQAQSEIQEHIDKSNGQCPYGRSDGMGDWIKDTCYCDEELNGK